MDEYTVCDNVFTYKCNGEVEVLIRAAERYGLLTEKAAARIEEICSRCKNFSCRAMRNIPKPAYPAA